MYEFRRPSASVWKKTDGAFVTAMVWTRMRVGKINAVGSIRHAGRHRSRPADDARDAIAAVASQARALKAPVLRVRARDALRRRAVKHRSVTHAGEHLALRLEPVGRL